MFNIFKKIEEMKAEKERLRQIRIEEEKKRNKQFWIMWSSIMIILIFLLFIIGWFFESHPQNDDAKVSIVNNKKQDGKVKPSVYYENEQKKILTNMMTKKVVYRDKTIKYWDEYETVKFGSYNTDGNKENGDEPIEWYVLERENNEILLFSKYVIDFYFNSNDFINVAFNDAEKELINIDKYNKENSISLEEINIYFNFDNMYGKDGENQRLATNVLGNITSDDYYKNESQNEIRDNMKFVLKQSVKNINSDKINVCNMYGQFKGRTTIRDDGYYTVKESAINDTKNYSIGFRPIITIVNKYNIPEQESKNKNETINVNETEVKETKAKEKIVEVERPILDLCYLLSKEDKVLKWDAIDFKHGLKFTAQAKLEPSFGGYYTMKLTDIKCSKITGSLLGGWTSDGKQYNIKSDGKVRTVYCLEDGKTIAYEVITAEYGEEKVYEYLRKLTNNELAKFIE